MISKPRDVQDFYFKQLRKLRIFTATENVTSDVVNLITTSNRYGLIFIGHPKGFQVIRAEDLLMLNEKDLLRVDVEEYPCHNIPLDSSPTHLAISSDDMRLSVCTVVDSCPFANIYDIRHFGDKNIIPRPVTGIRLSTQPSITLLDLYWNPSIANILATCLSDGSVTVYEVNDTSLKICGNLPSSVGCRAICWSPKGKQLVVGKINGTLSQYKPTLEEMKTIPAPNIFGRNVSVLNILWLSNFCFAVAYCFPDDPEERPSLVIVKTPKNETPSYINYEDVCYSSGDQQKPRYVMFHQSDWGVILCTSSNAIEVGVLGAASPDKTVWEQWILEDSGRAELPLSGKDETFPIGMAVCYNSSKEISLGENLIIPPMPIFLLLSTKGLLVPFYMVNTSPGTVSLVRPSEKLLYEGPIPAARNPVLAEPTTPKMNLMDKFNQVTEASPLSQNLSFQLPSRGVTGGVAQSTPLPTAKGFSFTSDVSGIPPFKVDAVSPSMGHTQLPSGGIMSGTPVITSSKSSKPMTPATAGQGGTTMSVPPISALSQLVANTGSSGAVASQPTLTPEKDSGSVLGGGNLMGKPSFSFLNVPNKNASQVSMGALAPGPSLSHPKPLSSNGKGVFSAQSPSSNLFVGIQTQPGVLTPKASPSSAVLARLGTGIPSATDAPLEEELKAINDKSYSSKNVFTTAILKEIDNFNKELQDLKARSSNVSYLVGTPDELRTLKESTEKLSQFSTDIKEATTGLNNEIHTLRTETLETFAMLEEARSRDQRNKDPRYRQLLQLRSLDPVRAKKIKHIRQMNHYVHNQSQEIHQLLDQQWEEFQASQKKLKKVVSLPTSETIYQCILNIQNLISVSNQKIDQLQKIADQVRQQENNTSFRISLSSVPALNLKNMDNIQSLSDSFINFKLESTNVVKSPAKTVSPEKQARLRNILGNRRPLQVRSSLPSSMSRLIAPKSRVKNEESRTSTTDLQVETPTDVSATQTAKSFTVGLPTNQFRPLGTMHLGTASNQGTTPISVPATVPSTPLLFTSAAVKGNSPTIQVPSPTAQPRPIIGTPTTKSPFTIPTGIGTGEVSLQTKLDGRGFSFTSLHTPNFPTFSSVTTASSVDKNSSAHSTSSTFTNFASSKNPVTTTSALALSSFQFKPVDTATTDKNNVSQHASVSSFSKPVPTNLTGNAGSNFTSILDSSSKSIETKPSNPSSEFSFTLGTTKFGDTKTLFTFGSRSQIGSGVFQFGAPTTKVADAASSFTFTLNPKDTFAKDKKLESVREEDMKTSGPVVEDVTPPSTPTEEIINPLVEEEEEENGQGVIIEELSSDFDIQREIDEKSSDIGVKSPKAIPVSIIQSEPEQPENSVVTSTTHEVTAAASIGQTSFQPFKPSLSETPLTSVPTLPQTTFKFIQPNSSIAVPASGLPSSESSVSVISPTSGQSSTILSLSTIGFQPSQPQASFGQATSVTNRPTDSTVTLNTSTVGGNTSIFGGAYVTSPGLSQSITTALTTSPPTTVAITTVPASSTFSFRQTGLGFGQASPSPVAFGQPTTTKSASAFDQVTTNSPIVPVFGQTTISSTVSSVFDQTTTTPAATAVNLPFGQTPTTSTITPGFAQTSTTSAIASAFGQASTTSVAAPAFGQTSTASTAPPGFGQTSTTNTAPPVFGQTSTTSTSPPGFGQTSTISAAPPAFGQASTTSTAPPAFGQTSTTSTAPPAFGQTSTTSAAPPAFGQTSTTSAAPPAFGQTSTTSTAPPAFGQTSTTNAATPGFGQAATTSAATPGFGQTATTSAATPGFGQTATTSAAPPGFGQTATTSAAPPGFGQTATTSAATPGFGQTATTSTATPGFGQPTTSNTATFGFGNTTSTATPAFGQTTTSSVFGSPSSGSTFGFAQSSSTSTGSPSLFGGNTGANAPSTFGQKSLFGGSSFGTFQQNTAAPVFGQTGSSVFGGSTAQSGAAFGQGSSEGFFSGLGGKPSAENANKNVFGGTSTFGSAPISSGQSLFGGQNSPAGFGNKFGSSFSGGSFSRGNSSVAQAGFGGFQQPSSPQPTQTSPRPGGFGGNPTFGGSPTFGTAASFGGSAVFGGNQAFGSTPANQASPGFVGFGTNTGSPTFGSLAAQTSPTFGNLAQSSNVPTFGSVANTSGPTFGAQNPPFGANPGFGSGGPVFGSQQQQQQQQPQQQQQQQQPGSSASSFSQWR